MSDRPAGGPRSVGGIPAITYQPRSVNNHRVAPTVAESPLIAAVQAFAQHLFETIPDKSRRDARFLSDLMRPDLRYGFSALDRLLQLAPRGQNPHGLETAIRREVLQRMPTEPDCLVTATIDETIAQSALDPW